MTTSHPLLSIPLSLPNLKCDKTNVSRLLRIHQSFGHELPVELPSAAVVPAELLPSGVESPPGLDAGLVVASACCDEAVVKTVVSRDDAEGEVAPSELAEAVVSAGG